MTLLHLPGDKWVLVDCHLPARAARERFYALADKLNVRSLDLLILTHPHIDHYDGMADVIDYFSRDGRSILRFGCGGASFFDVVKAMEGRGRPEEELSEYRRLWRALRRLIDRDQLDYLRLDDNSRPVEFGTHDRSVRLIALSPRAGKVDLSVHRQAGGERPGLAVNELSVVLVLRLALDAHIFQAILTGDSETRQLEAALETWKGWEENPTTNGGFHVAKVPHHGSGNGHCQALVLAKARDSGIAVISVGTKYNLPKRHVIGAYRVGGWRVFSTTTRSGTGKVDLLLSQFARQGKPAAPPSPPATSEQDVLVSWGPLPGLRFSPPGSEIEPRHLGDYPV